MMRQSEMLLNVTLQIKSGLGQAIPLLEMISQKNPAYLPVYESYKVIISELDKTIATLKEMKD
jgi:hypothetical protein